MYSLVLRMSLVSVMQLTTVHNLSFKITRDIRATNENIYTQGAETWTPQKENNADRREFCSKQTHFSVNSDIQHHGKIY
jgi:hypothetical protein